MSGHRDVRNVAKVASASMDSELLIYTRNPETPARTPLVNPAPSGACGVYVFWPEQAGQGLPLYVGKSVDLRARIAAHRRNPDEAAMMARVGDIELHFTAGEVGALLLEAQLIKSLQPLFNVRLRRVRRLSTWVLVQSNAGLDPRLVNAEDDSLGVIGGQFGLFSSRHAAQEQLRSWAQIHQLCLACLGLEGRTGPRGCFGRQIGRCLGACRGDEPRETHDARLMAALRQAEVAVWPFDGPVDLVEQQGDWVQRHRIWRWRHLGTLDSREPLSGGQLSWSSQNSASLSGKATPAFDLDTYKILLRPVLSGEVEPVSM